MDTSPIISYDDLPVILTVPEAAEVLRIGRHMAYDLARCGRLPTIQIGKRMRVPRSGLISYIENEYKQ